MGGPLLNWWKVKACSRSLNLMITLRLTSLLADWGFIGSVVKSVALFDRVLLLFNITSLETTGGLLFTLLLGEDDGGSDAQELAKGY